MSTPTIKTKVAVDGETEYKAAIADINMGLRTLGSEMNLVRTRFAENGESVEALTAKQDVLGRQLSTQKEKVEALRAALQNSAKEHGEADARTQKWQQSLNRAEGELIKTQRELDATTAALENQGSTLVGLGSGLDDITGKFGIHLPEGLKNTLDSVMQVDSGMLGLVTTAAAVGGAVFKVIDALAGMTTEAAASADDLLTLSQVSGLGTDTLQELEFMAERLDVSVDTLTSSMTKLTRNMGEAADGSTQAQAKFDKLGLSIYDTHGNLKSAEVMFYEVIDALGAMDNATARDAAAMDLMGRSAQDLNPAILAGTDTMKKWAAEAHEWYVRSEQELQVLAKLTEALDEYEKSQKHAREELALHFGPALEEFYEEFSKQTRDLGEATANSGVVEFFGAILEVVAALTPILSILSDVVSDSLGPALKVLATILAAVADILSIIVNLAAALVNALQLDFSGAGQNLSNAWDTFSGADSATTRVINSYHVSHNASGDMNFGGGLTRVGEAGPETVYLPQGSRIFSNQESEGVGGNVWYVTIDAKNMKEFGDIVRLAESARRMERMGRK